MPSWIRLHPKDHVAVALRDISKGEIVSLESESSASGQVLESFEARDPIPKGHKILIRPVLKGEDILKFGYSIGKAKEDLSVGSWVHTHNMKTGLKGVLEYVYEPNAQASVSGTDSKLMFPGYTRANGEIGIRNEIWIINTVGCINKTCETLARLASSRYQGRVDGIYHFPHPFGCSQLGDDLQLTQKLLVSLAQHPNAAGVLVVGLGCENNQIESFRHALGEYNGDRVLFMKTQEVEDEIETGLELIGRLVANAETFKREPVPVSKLKLGLKCGGSDGLSGITANPLAGAVSDWLIGEGGTAILTEVPEMFGAEALLLERAADEDVFHKIEALINEFKHYFMRHDQEIYENPSPGNKAGGITTLEEKSLGCTQKGGHAVITDVVSYGGRVSRSGLNLLQGPGNDLVSITALAAAGAHLVLFTTGRGTPFGGPVPTLKISTNSELAAYKKNWIDFNAGQLLEDKGMDDLRNELAEHILRIASGETLTQSERNGYREIAIFKDGVIL